MQERRKFPRVAYPCKLRVFVDGDKKELDLHTENISSGGAKVILQTKLEINTPIEIEIAIGDRQLISKGRVVWVLDIEKPGASSSDLFDTGIEFAQLGAENREFLTKLVEKLRAQPQ